MHLICRRLCRAMGTHESTSSVFSCFKGRVWSTTDFYSHASLQAAAVLRAVAELVPVLIVYNKSPPKLQAAPVKYDNILAEPFFDAWKRPPLPDWRAKDSAECCGMTFVMTCWCTSCLVCYFNGVYGGAIKSKFRQIGWYTVTVELLCWWILTSSRNHQSTYHTATTQRSQPFSLLERHFVILVLRLESIMVCHTEQQRYWTQP